MTGEPMSQHLRDMRIDKVSLVDKGANEKRFAVLKQDDTEPTHVSDERNLIQKVLDAIDQRFQPVMVEPTTPGDTVEKAGRAISGPRLAGIKQAMHTLYDIVEEVEPGWWTPPGGSISKEYDDMADEQQQAEATPEVVTKADLDALKDDILKAVAEAVKQPEPEKAEPVETPEPAEDEVTIDTLAEAVTELAKRMDNAGRGRRQSIDGQGTEPVKKSSLAGILN